MYKLYTFLENKVEKSKEDKIVIVIDKKKPKTYGKAAKKITILFDFFFFCQSVLYSTDKNILLHLKYMVLMYTEPTLSVSVCRQCFPRFIMAIFSSLFFFFFYGQPLILLKWILRKKNWIQCCCCCCCFMYCLFDFCFCFSYNV